MLSLIQKQERKQKSMKNTWKMETSKDFTSWDLNCRDVLPHKKNQNELEKKFRRKNRRKIKKELDKYCDR